MKPQWLDVILRQFKIQRDQEEAKYPASAVLLLRTYRPPQETLLSEAAARAWNVDFATGDPGARYFVTPAPPSTYFVKVGSHLLTVFGFAAPYAALDEHALRNFLPDELRQTAWQAHHAWIALDCVRSKLDEECKYALLCNLASELLDENCTAVYFPKVSSILPNDETAYRQLKQIAASRHVEIR